MQPTRMTKNTQKHLLKPGAYTRNMLNLDLYFCFDHIFLSTISMQLFYKVLLIHKTQNVVDIPKLFMRQSYDASRKI